MAYLSASKDSSHPANGSGLLHHATITKELSLLSAREFMQLLRERFNVRVLVIGYDHRFGHNRCEGFDDYCQYGKELGIEVIRAQALIEDGVSISSSVIRKVLKTVIYNMQIII